MQTLTGNEHFTYDGMPVGILLNDFWAWNSSDLLNNTLRGALQNLSLRQPLALIPPYLARTGRHTIFFLRQAEKSRSNALLICKAGIRSACLKFSSVFALPDPGMQKMISAPI